MEIKRLSYFAGNNCTDCRIIQHPNLDGKYILKHSTEKVLTESEKQKIIAELQAQKQQLSLYNKQSDIDKIDADLAMIE